MFNAIKDSWGPFDIHLFAYRLNLKVSPHVSWRPDPGAQYVNVFFIVWRPHFFTPFHLSVSLPTACRKSNRTNLSRQNNLGLHFYGNCWKSTFSFFLSWTTFCSIPTAKQFIPSANACNQWLAKCQETLPSASYFKVFQAYRYNHCKRCVFCSHSSLIMCLLGAIPGGVSTGIAKYRGQ